MQFEQIPWLCPAVVDYSAHFQFVVQLNERNLIICISVMTHTTVLRSSWILSSTTRVSRHQRGKTNLDLLEQEIVIGSDISWAICKSAP